MGLFSRRKTASPVAPPTSDSEHAVLLHYALGDEEFGAEEERQAIYDLEDRLTRAVHAADAGEVDGHEFGGGEAVVYLYGPDADRLWAAVERPSQDCTLRPAYAMVRYGGPGSRSMRVDLA